MPGKLPAGLLIGEVGLVSAVWKFRQIVDLESLGLSLFDGILNAHSNSERSGASIVSSASIMPSRFEMRSDAFWPASPSCHFSFLPVLLVPAFLEFSQGKKQVILRLIESLYHAGE